MDRSGIVGSSSPTFLLSTPPSAASILHLRCNNDWLKSKYSLLSVLILKCRSLPLTKVLTGLCSTYLDASVEICVIGTVNSSTLDIALSQDYG